MLRKIYYLYKTNPEIKFKEFGSIFEKTVQKPSKSTGTCWLAHSQDNGNNSYQLWHFYGSH